MCLFDGQHDLLADLFLEDVIRIGCISSCVNHRKFGSAPLASAVMSVTCHSGCFVNDGLAHPHQTVEKGGFAHIRASYDC